MVLHILLVCLLGAAPTGPEANGKKSAASDLDRGQKLLTAGNVEGALAAFDNAAKVDPKDARPAYLRGVALEKKHDFAGAEKAYRLAVSLDGKLAQAHNNLGALLLAKDDLSAAEKAFLAAISADAKNAGAHFNLGLLRDRQRKPGEAVAAYRKAVALKPNEAAFHLNLSSALRKSGDVDAALGEANQAVKLSPDNALALTNLGLLLSEKQRFDEARAVFITATNRDSALVEAWVGLGRAGLRAKDPIKAVEAFSKAAALSPKDAAIAAELCRAYVTKDLAAKESLVACQKAVKMDAHNALAQYELIKVLVAKGDCTGAKAGLGNLQSLQGIKSEALTKAQAIVKTCVQGKPAKSDAAK